MHPSGQPECLLQPPHLCLKRIPSVLQYPLCLNLMASKKVDVMPLITHRFGFTPEDVAAAFDCAARSAETRAIKVMFNLP